LLEAEIETCHSHRLPVGSFTNRVWSRFLVWAVRSKK